MALTLVLLFILYGSADSAIITSQNIYILNLSMWIDNRISSCELIIPPKTSGPPPHWHEMHDETFLITKGTVRFHIPKAEGLEPKVVDAKAGDYMVVPTRAPHTFSNETDEEARFFNTFTPVFKPRALSYHC
jgi:oxalate decarboxylase/phosphoglucose isomerase-like protein (cupin superfamily)